MLQTALIIFFIAAIILGPAFCELPIEPEYEAFHGPPSNSKDDFKVWFQGMKSARDKFIQSVKYNDSYYSDPRAHWAASNFIQPQVMVNDKLLFDPSTGTYTIDKYLDDLNRRYNGIDSVLIWQAYPNLGIDSRNQFQLLDDLPAGGLSELVDAFHKRDVKVFIPYNPWDTGTHASSSSDADMIKSYVDKYGVDGFNGDTMYGVESQFVEPSFANKSSKLIVAQPESGLPDADIQFDLQSWAYLVYPDSSYYTFAPMISRPKWFESRHKVQLCNRWS